MIGHYLIKIFILWNSNTYELTRRRIGINEVKLSSDFAIDDSALNGRNDKFNFWANG